MSRGERVRHHEETVGPFVQNRGEDRFQVG
jgi:hypothetical protein